jgi:hypothetical protein
LVRPDRNFLLEQKHYDNAVKLLEKAWEMTRKTAGSILTQHLKALPKPDRWKKP